jgi:hypothetical protein
LAPPRKKKLQKKRKPATEAEATKQNSDNTVDTRGSIGSSGIQAGGDIGDVEIDQNIIISATGPPIREPVNVLNENLIWIGRKVMKALFGTLVHSMTGYFLGSLGLVGVALGFGYYVYERNPFPSGSQSSSLLTVSSWGVILLSIYLGPLLVKVSGETICPKCSARFSWYEKERLITNTKRLPGRTIINGFITERCRECKHIVKSPCENVEYDESSS